MNDPKRSWGHSEPISLFDSLESNAKNHPHERKNPPKQHFIGLFDSTPITSSLTMDIHTSQPISPVFTYIPQGDEGHASSLSSTPLISDDPTHLSDIFPELSDQVHPVINIIDRIDNDCSKIDGKPTSYNYGTPLSFWQSIFLPPSGTFDEIEIDEERYPPYNHVHVVPPRYQTGCDEELTKIAPSHSFLLSHCKRIESYSSSIYQYPTTFLATEYGIHLQPYELYLLCALLIGLPKCSIDDFTRNIFPGPLFDFILSENPTQSISVSNIHRILIQYLPIFQQGPTGFINALNPMPLLRLISTIFRSFLPDDYGTIDDMGESIQNELNNNHFFHHLYKITYQLGRICGHNIQQTASIAWRGTNIFAQHILDNVETLCNLIWPFESSLIDQAHQINPFNAFSKTHYLTSLFRYIVNNILFKPQYWLFPTLFMFYPLAITPLLTPNIFSSSILPLTLPSSLYFPFYWFANTALINIPLYLYKRLWLSYGHNTPFTISDFLQRVFSTLLRSLKSIYTKFSSILITSQQLIAFIPCLIYHYSLRVLKMNEMITDLQNLEMLLLNYNQVISYQRLIKQVYLIQFQNQQKQLIQHHLAPQNHTQTQPPRNQNFFQQSTSSSSTQLASNQNQYKFSKQYNVDDINKTNVNNIDFINTPIPILHTNMLHSSPSSNPTPMLQQWQASLYLGSYQPEYMIQTMPLSNISTTSSHTVSTLSSYQYYFFQIPHHSHNMHTTDHHEFNPSNVLTRLHSMPTPTSSTHISASAFTTTISPIYPIKLSPTTYLHDVEEYLSNQLLLRNIYYQQQFIQSNYLEEKTRLLSSHLTTLSTLNPISNSTSFLTTLQTQSLDQYNLESEYSIQKKTLGPKVIKTDRNVYDDFCTRKYLEDNGIFLLQIPTQKVFLITTIPPPAHPTQTHQDYQLPLTHVTPVTISSASTSASTSMMPIPTTPTRSYSNPTTPPLLSASPSTPSSTPPSTPSTMSTSHSHRHVQSKIPATIMETSEIDSNYDNNSHTLSHTDTGDDFELTDNQATDNQNNFPLPPQTNSPNTPYITPPIILSASSSHPSTLHVTPSKSPHNPSFISTPHSLSTKSPLLTTSHSALNLSTDISSLYTQPQSDKYAEDEVFFEIAITPAGQTTSLIHFTKRYLQQKEQLQKNLLYQQQVSEHNALLQLHKSIKKAKKAIDLVSPSLEMSLAHIHNNISSSFSAFIGNFKKRGKEVLDTISVSLFFPKSSSSSSSSSSPSSPSLSPQAQNIINNGSVFTPQDIIDTKRSQREAEMQQQFLLDLALQFHHSPHSISTFPQLKSSSYQTPVENEAYIKSLLPHLTSQPAQYSSKDIERFITSSSNDILSTLSYTQHASDSTTTSFFKSLLSNVPAAVLAGSTATITNTIQGISDFFYGVLKLSIKTTIAIIVHTPLVTWAALKRLWAFIKYIGSSFFSLLFSVIKIVFKIMYYAIKTPLMWLYNTCIIAPISYTKRLFNAVFYHVSLSRFLYNIFPPLPKIIHYPLRLLLAPLAAALIIFDRAITTGLYISVLYPVHACFVVSKWFLQLFIRHIKVFDGLLYNYGWVYIENVHKAIVSHLPFIGVLLPLPDLFGHYVHVRYEFDKLIHRFGPNYYLLPLYNIAYALIIKLPLHVTKYFISQIYHLFHFRDFLLYLSTYDFLSPTIHTILHIMDFFNQFFYTYFIQPRVITAPDGTITEQSAPIVHTIYTLVKGLVIFPATILFKPTFSMISSVWSFFFNFKSALQTLQFAESIHDKYIPNFYVYNPINQEYEFAVGDNLAKRLHSMKISLQEKTYDTLTSIPYVTDSPENMAFVRHPMAWDTDTTRDIQRVKILAFSDSEKFNTTQPLDFIASIMYALAALPSYEAYLRTFLPYLTHYSPVITFLKISSNHQEISTYNMWRGAIKDLKQYWDRNKYAAKYTPRELRNIIEEQQINGIYYGTRGIPGQNGFLHPLLQAEKDTIQQQNEHVGPSGGRSISLPGSLSFTELLGLGKKDQQHKIPHKHHEPHEFFIKYIQMIGSKLVQTINDRRKIAFDEMVDLKKKDTSLQALLPSSSNIPEFKLIPEHTPYLQPPMSFYTTTLITCSECGITRGISSTNQTSLTVQPFICSEFLPFQGLIEHAMRPKTISNQQFCDVCDLIQRIEFGHRLMGALKKQIVKRFDDAYNAQYPDKQSMYYQTALSQRNIQFQNYTYGKWEQLNLYMDDNVYNVIYSNRYSFQYESYPQTLLRVQYELINLQYQLLLCFHPQLALFYQQQQSLYIHQMNSRYLQQYNAKVQLPAVTFDWLLHRTFISAKDKQAMIFQQQQQQRQLQTQQAQSRLLSRKSASNAISATSDGISKRNGNGPKKRLRKSAKSGGQKGGPDTSIDPSSAISNDIGLELHKYFNTDYFDQKSGVSTNSNVDEIARNNVDFIFITITIQPNGTPITKIRFVQDTLTQFLSSIPPFSAPKCSEEVLINMNSKHTSLLSSLVKIITPSIPYFDFYIKRIPASLDSVIKPIPNKTSNYEQQTFITTLPQILPVQFQIFDRATNAKLNTKIAFPQFYNASLLLPALVKRSLGKPTGLNSVNMQYYFSQQPNNVSTSTSNGLVFQDFLTDPEETTLKHPEAELLDQKERQVQLKKDRILNKLDFSIDYDTINPSSSTNNTNNNSKSTPDADGNLDGASDEEIVDPVFLLPHNTLTSGPNITSHSDRPFYSTNPLYAPLNSSYEEYDAYLMRQENLKFQRKQFYTSTPPIIHNGSNDEDTYLYAVMAIIVHFGDSLDDHNGKFVTYRRVLPTFHLDGLGRRRCINFTTGYMNPVLSSNSIFSAHPSTYGNDSTQLDESTGRTSRLSSTKPSTSLSSPEHIVDLSYETKSKSRFNQLLHEGDFMQLPTMLQMSTTSSTSLSTTIPSSLTQNSPSLSSSASLQQQQQQQQQQHRTPNTPFEATQYSFGLREAFLFDLISGKKRSVKERFDAIQEFLKQHTQWVLCTPTTITPTSEYTVMNCLPYMIFYERI